ncbi:portal protein [Providencia heimbachae]|uniref:portal protein n=1 Tax=Providencia heimbachae TaxID=333962 RepID=UPI001419568F|nr:portal protein [Providencia heimbachae]NIH21849.1 portal protein [Providencia heimbachae]
MVDRNERLDKILRKFDLDYSAAENARKEARNDLFFSRVSQWDDWLESYVTLQYRGQFDVVRPMVRKLVAEMRKNPIEVQYRPKDNAPVDAADILMGMYRTDMRNNSSKIAVNVAVREQIECGYGAWRIVTEYEDDNPTSNNQIIRRVPMHESCTHVIWDCNSKAMDKSDAKNCTIIHAMNIDGWEAFAEQFGLDAETIPSFQSPNNDLLFNWSNGKTIHIAEYYEIEEKKELVFVYRDPLTDDFQTYSAKEAKEKIDELAESGYQKVGERRVKKRRVYKSIVTSIDVLKDKMPIAGENIPIVPLYGEWSFFDDNELYEGVVRISKDAQRLRNFILSRAADTAAKSPKKKPFFFAEQIAGYEHMYSGDDEFPYYIINKTDENGNDLPPSPVAYMENAEVSQADALLLEVATDAAKSTARVGVDPDAANGQVAFDTVNQLNSRIDLETYVFQDNLAIAMRRDGEIYASIAAEIYDTQRTVTTTAEDGGENQIELMQEELDFSKGEMVTHNDIRGKYETFTDVGPSFQSQKDAARAEISDLITKVPPEHPIWNVMMLTYANMLEGKGIETIRDYANKELITKGLKKPETEEEQQWLMEAQQAAQSNQDPMEEMARAETVKAQAEMQNSQNRMMETQIKAFTAQQQAQESQANTVYKMAQARDIDEKAVREAIDLLSRLSQQQQQNIPSDNNVENNPQTM